MQISIESGALYRRCSTLPWLLGVAFWQICYWYDVWHVTQGCRLKGPNFLDDLLADLNRKNACMYKEMNDTCAVKTIHIALQTMKTSKLGISNEFCWTCKPLTVSARAIGKLKWLCTCNMSENVSHGTVCTPCESAPFPICNIRIQIQL